FLNRLNSRDHEAFKQLFREYFQDIAYYSSKILKDTDVAEDVAQDVFIRLWEKENHFENYLALKSYLYLSARNSCLNYIKHHNIVLEHAQNPSKKKPTNKRGTRLSRHYQFIIRLHPPPSGMCQNHGTRDARVQQHRDFHLDRASSSTVRSQNKRVYRY
ncbi:MAG: sigma-70 family RNA polymerase sigma factor, partial [Butyricimonas paravirosa]